MRMGKPLFLCFIDISGKLSFQLKTLSVFKSNLWLPWSLRASDPATHLPNPAWELQGHSIAWLWPSAAYNRLQSFLAVPDSQTTFQWINHSTKKKKKRKIDCLPQSETLLESHPVELFIKREHYRCRLTEARPERWWKTAYCQLWFNAFFIKEGH